MILEEAFNKFKSLFVRDNTRPTVKKVSALVDNTSHKQKKYLSLMLVPSYSGGKTRSLRVPRAVFHGIIVGVLAISSVVAGISLNAHHHRGVAEVLSNHLEETQTEFAEFQEIAEQVQTDLIEVAEQIYEQLSEEQQRAQRELDRRNREHQGALEDIWDRVDELEELIRYFDESRQRIIEGLGARSIIPPVANLIAQLEAAQEEILSQLDVNIEEFYHEDEQTVLASTGFLSVSGYAGRIYNTETQLQNRIDMLLLELDVQHQLLENLESYRSRMDVHLRNHPTLWPINGRISSGFGWRRNPFGGRGSEHHSGVDIPARTGTQIRATGGGRVTFSGWRNGYGNTIVIDHGNGIQTLYAHNSRNRVSVGQRVERGDIIGYVGSTGRSTGPHLHYEVIVNGTAVNPVPFLLERH